MAHSWAPKAHPSAGDDQRLASLVRSCRKVNTGQKKSVLATIERQCTAARLRPPILSPQIPQIPSTDGMLWSKSDPRRPPRLNPQHAIDLLLTSWWQTPKNTTEYIQRPCRARHQGARAVDAQREPSTREIIMLMFYCYS